MTSEMAVRTSSSLSTRYGVGVDVTGITASSAKCRHSVEFDSDCETTSGDSAGGARDTSEARSSLWCPLGSLGALTADLTSRLSSSVSRLDLAALTRHKAPLFSLPSALSWCSCLQKDEPPEITHCIDKCGSSVRGMVHSLTPTQPMPTAEDVELKFVEVLDELDLTATNRAAMLSLSLEKKWLIYCSRKKKDDTDNGNGHSYLARLPDYYIDKVVSLSGLSFPSNSDELMKRTKQLESLRTALRTQPNSFVIKFVQLRGVEACQQFLHAMDPLTADSSIHTSLIGCVKALMNNTNGRSHVLAHPDALNVVSQSLSCENVKTKVAVLEILGAVCLVPGGHRKVLESMTYYQSYSGERTRFQRIINDLDRTMSSYSDEVSLKTAIMSFINAVLSCGAGADSCEFRLHVRYELLMLGVQPVIDKLRRLENETLDRHLNFFEMVRVDDEREMAKRYDQVHVDTKSATAMFELLRQKLNNTPAYPHLLSLLQHCLLLPLDYGSYPNHWMLFNRVCQQLILQSESGEDGDLRLVDINVNSVVKLLADEQEMVRCREQLLSVQRDNSELLARLSDSEQRCRQLLEQRDQLSDTVSSLQVRINSAALDQVQAVQRLSQLAPIVNDTGGHNPASRTSSSSLSCSVGGVPAVNSTIAPAHVNDNCPAVSPDAASPPCVPPPPPPPPPPPAPPAPPQAPPAACMRAKNVPVASMPLKSFNWSKLPTTRLAGTIWTELDADDNIYSYINLPDVDRTFSAYQRQNSGVESSSMDDLTSVGGGAGGGTLNRTSRVKVISVIDARRAQNCTILLSKLKLSDKDINHVLMSMDSGDQLPPDMVEQLLKFTPSVEEKALLAEHSGDLNSLARADRFLYEISRIDHYEARLRALFYQKRFGERCGDVRPRIAAVLDGCTQLRASRRLRRLLQLVLAFGNYMNRGQRANAHGFKLDSLRRIGDTKSSTCRQLTLLHYITQLMEVKFSDTLRLAEDLSHIHSAAKVNMNELEKDMATIRGGLREIHGELQFQQTRSSSTSASDQFVPTMKDFVAKAAYKCRQLDEQFNQMKNQFGKVVAYFGEDPSNIQPDEFFGVFDAFLAAFSAAVDDNNNAKRKRLDEEKRLRLEQEMKQMTQQRRGHRSQQLRRQASVATELAPAAAGTEFDDLISALRTGEAFSDNFGCGRRKKRISPPSTESRLSRRFSESRERSVGIV